MFSLKKGMGLVLTGLLATSVLAGCGNATQATPTSGSGAAPTQSVEEISFYFGGSLNVKELWDTLVPMFEQKNPNIKVKMVYSSPGQGGETTMDRLIAAKKAGQTSVGIDLFEAGDSEIVLGAKEGIWTKLDQSAIPNLSKVDATYLKAAQNLAVPYRASSVVLAYNSKNIPTPPKTADELYQWIRQHPGKFAYNDPATGGSGSSFVQTAIYNSLPPEAMQSSDPSMMAQWDKGFQLLKDLGPSMYQKGVYPKKNQGTLDILASGEVDMIPAWSDMALEQLSKKLLPDTIKLTQIEPAFTGGPSYLMVPAMSQHQQAVAKFLDFVLTPEAQTVVINKMFGYPGIKWSEMPSDYQKKFESVAKGYRLMNIGQLGGELNKRWQKEVAGQ